MLYRQQIKHSKKTMFRRTNLRAKWIAMYLLLLFSSTLVILGMVINMHNRDCSEQVVLKTYALIKSMTNGNPYEQQKLLSQLIQDESILLQDNRNGLRNVADNMANERMARSTFNRLSSKINAIQENNYIGAELHQHKPKEETVKVDDGLQALSREDILINNELPPTKEEAVKSKDDLPKKDAPRKKLDLSNGLRSFELDPNDSPPRQVKIIPSMETVKSNLRKALAKHINQDELTRIRERLIASGLSFNRTVTTLIEGDTEEETEIRKQELSSKMDTPFESCAVIGNGGVLDRSYCGAEIDAHDFVMRSNQAPIVGFEEDVGSKVHFMTLNGEGTKTLIKCIKTFNTSCRRVYQSIKTIDNSIIWFSKYGVLNQKFTALMAKHLNSTVTHPSEPLSEEIMKFWDITDHPSSGLFLYSIAAPLCKTISLYGFYPYSKLPNGQPTRYHYYENFYIEDFDMGHDLPKEFKLLMKLNRAGALRLRTKPCF